MVDVVHHGDELDAAMAVARGPEDLGICLTALESRRNAFVTGQVEAMLKMQQDTYFRRDLRVALEREPSEEELLGFALRSVIGGAFTFGISTGLELSRPADG